MNLEELIKEQILAEGPDFESVTRQIEYIQEEIEFMTNNELLKRISDTLEEAGILPFRGGLDNR